MYLAHLAQSKDLLGNGEISQGDTVICATGEVNTTNYQILAVTQVAVKFKLAKPQLEKWTALGAKVQFLLPQANHSDVEKSSYTLLVNNIEQAAAVLPSNTQNPTSPSVEIKKFVSINFRHITTFALCAVVLTMIFGLSTFTLTDISDHQNVVKKATTPKLESTPKIQLVAVFKQAKTCAQTSSENIVLTNKTFADLTLNQLCKLYLETYQPTEQVLLIARDAFTVMPLKQSQQGWQIPIPKNQLSDRSYFLVTLIKTFSEETIEQLRLYREAMPKSNMLTESTLAPWLEKQEVVFTVYTHKLVLQ
jgi:hypothetical protein